MASTLIMTTPWSVTVFLSTDFASVPYSNFWALFWYCHVCQDLQDMKCYVGARFIILLLLLLCALCIKRFIDGSG